MYNAIQFYQEMKENSYRLQNNDRLTNINLNSKELSPNKSSQSSLNKYGRSPYLQKITQGFSLPKKKQNLSSSIKLKEQPKNINNNEPQKQLRQGQKNSINLHNRSQSNIARFGSPRASPNFKLPKIDDHIKTQRKQKLSSSSFSATLDLTNKKKKLIPIKPTFRRAYVTKTKAGTNGKQTKINQDIAIIQNTLPHGVKLYCVCDGHGLNGHLVSSFIKHHLIKNLTNYLKKCSSEIKNIQKIFQEALAHTNQQLLSSDINTQLSGSTVIAIFIHKETIYSLNVGDSRAILANQNKDIWSILPLSDDQKPSRQDQKKRILEFGGRIQAQKNQRGQQIGPQRVWMKNIQMPGLAMTRSFGDKAGIKAGTNGEPQLIVQNITSNDKFLVVASDGVWQYLQNQEVMNIIIPFFLKHDIELAAEKVLRISTEIWHKLSYSRDDITLIIISLNPPNVQQEENKEMYNHQTQHIKNGHK